jgi:hypothetical protein
MLQCGDGVCYSYQLLLYWDHSETKSGDENEVRCHGPISLYDSSLSCLRLSAFPVSSWLLVGVVEDCCVW